MELDIYLDFMYEREKRVNVGNQCSQREEIENFCYALVVVKKKRKNQ